MDTFDLPSQVLDRLVRYEVLLPGGYYQTDDLATQLNFDPSRIRDTLIELGSSWNITLQDGHLPQFLHVNFPGYRDWIDRRGEGVLPDFEIVQQHLSELARRSPGLWAQTSNLPNYLRAFAKLEKQQDEIQVYLRLMRGAMYIEAPVESRAVITRYRLIQ